MLLGLMLSLGWVLLWIAAGVPRMVLYLVVLGLFTTVISSSLRGAVEHHGPTGDSHMTNEYRALLPLFHMNRHMDHHAHPGRPWYQLRFQTARPLPASASVMHWVRVYVTRQYVMMQPHGAGAQARPAPQRT
jgi:fatty acid desaturase